MAAAERGVLQSTNGGRLSQPFGTAAVPSAAVLRGYCGSTHRCVQAPAGSARLVRGRGGCYARYGGRHRVAHALRGTRQWYGYSGVRVVSCVGTRGRHRPIRTARRAPSRPITRRSPSHRRPMGRGRGLRSAIARGRSGAAGGAGAGRCDPSRLSQVSWFKWAGRDAAAGARPADRPGRTVSPVLSHAADAALLRRPCAAPHCVSAWGDVLQSARHEQVHRHDRELGRQHLEARLSVRPLPNLHVGPVRVGGQQTEGVTVGRFCTILLASCTAWGGIARRGTGTWAALAAL